MSFNEFIERQHWIYAKTYADKAPHEYCLREKVVGSDNDFLDAVRYIWENGFIAYFWKKPNVYLFHNGYFYWIMDPHPEEGKTILINRCRNEDYKLTFFYERKEQDVLQGE